MNPAIRPILEELKAGLTALYGDRLDRVILYGSQARGDARPDSDIDVLVVLKEPFDLAHEMDRTADLYLDMMIRHGIDIPRHIRWQGDITPTKGLFRTLLREGVRI